MTSERWRKIEELFQAAVTRPLEERNAFLNQACVGDDSVQREVEKLLASDGAGIGRLEKIASGVAAGWMRESERRELIGQSFGRYKIVAPLGSGGMGEVYLARDTTLGRKVALKLLPRQFTQDRDRLRRFEQEARAASALNHPNIITIHEIGEWNGVPFIAAEYIEGQTLRDYIEKPDRPLSEILEIAMQVAAALAAAHKTSIIHRDIKPANIMLRRDGYIKVLDFGLAKLATTNAPREVTDPGRVMGTAHYMSPEQALGQPVDHRTDIFSFGAVLYEMATGHRPFEGDTEAAIYDSILNKMPLPLADFDAQLPVEFDEVIRRALEKDPAQRYQTVADLRADLKLLAQGSSATDAGLLASRRPPQRTMPSAHRMRSPRLGILLVAGLIVSSLAVLGIIVAPSILKQRRAREETKPTNNSGTHADSVEPSPITAAAMPEKSIAVLPFENLSDDKNAAYFADGIQDEILTKLAGIADLRVISRTSAAKYKSKPEDLKTVSQQLGVANVLEGRVQKVADKVRVNVQLIDARTDSHLWARSFDGDAKDILAIETIVAQEVADSLQAKLSPAEASKLVTAPTKDPAAYDLLLKGNYELRLAHSSLQPESFDQAATWYQQAIALDPSFALAMARLVECRMLRHWFLEPFTEAELAAVERLAERALTLEPNLAEAHIGLGTYYYYGYRQYEQALAAFARAAQLQPNNSEALEYSAYVHRRQDQWVRSLEEFQKALEQDPRNARLAISCAENYCQLREWSNSESIVRRALAIDPHEVVGMRTLLLSIVNGRGDIQEAVRVLASYPSDKLIVNSNVGHVTGVTGERAYTFVLARDYQAALKVWDGAASTAADERRRLSARVAIHVIAGDLAGAQADAQKARPLLEQWLRDRPNEILTKTELSWVYLALKRNAEAVKLARQSAAFLPSEKDALVGDHNVLGQATIASQTGAAAEAVAILRRLLSVPAGLAVSIARLKIDPVWDPIRNDPQFQQLLTTKEQIGP